MEKKLTTNDMKSLIGHVIKIIDRWWVEKTNIKQGYFTRSNMANPLITYTDYVEWRYTITQDSKNYAYESIFISLDLEEGTDYIGIALKRMKNGAYAKYDPFCEIYDGKTEVVFSEQTGFGPDNILRDVINTKDFDELVDKIADTVHKFVTPSDEDEPNEYDEEKVSVNMDDVSKTLSFHDIQDCMIKAVRIMLVDRDTVNELIRLRSKYAAQDQLTTTQCENMLGYSIEATPKHVVARIIYDNTFIICSFICGPDTHGQHEFIIRYNSRDTGFKYEQGFNILYKNPDNYCFEYAADGLNVDKIFKPFVNILRNTLNYELYQSRFQDTTITAPAVKPGLTTKEVFVLDKDYFKIGDIYCLHIHPEFQEEVHLIYTGSTAVNATLPKWVYAICSDVCDTAIDFAFKRADKNDLVYIQIHAEDIEEGLIEVTRQLTNETLIQDEEDKQNA